MIANFDNYNYALYLCKPDNNRTQLGTIIYTSLSYRPRFRNVDELEIDINYIEPTPQGSIDNPTFDLVKGHFFIQMDIKDGDNLIKTQFFVINTPSIQAVDVDKKHILAYSLEYMWNKKLLRSYKQESGLLYDFTGTNGILNYMFTNKLNNVWSIGTVSDSLKNKYRYFDFPSSKLLEVVRQLEKVFSCVFVFHTDTYKVDVVALSEYGSDMGLYLSENNYIKHIQKEEKFEQVVTRLFVYGKNNMTIASKNITGMLYVDNFSAFRSLIYMSQDLLNALDDYDTLLSNNNGTYQGYLTSLGALQTTLLGLQQDLANLNIALKEYQDNENAEIKQEGSTGHNYAYWYNLEQAQKSLITAKVAEITSTQSSINTVNSNITTLNSTLSYSSNFSANQLKELQNFIFEDTMTISEIDDELTLYNEAVYQVNKLATVPVDFSIDVVSFLDLIEGKPDWEKLNLGDYITVNYSKMNDISNITLRLVGYSHNPITNSLQLEFSTKDQFNADYYYMTQMWQATQQTGNTVTVERPNYNLFVDEKGNIIYNGQIISSVNNPIVLPDGSIIDSNGFQLRDSSDSDSQMRILGNRILFTNNNWQDVTVGIDGDGIHSLNIYGSHIQGGDIKVETDIYVGNNVFIGDMAETSKSIVFFNDNAGQFSIIEFDINSELWVRNTCGHINIATVGSGSTYITSDNRVSINAHELVFASGNIIDESYNEIDGGLFQITKNGSGDIYFHHAGRGNQVDSKRGGDIWFNNVGQTEIVNGERQGGRIKITATYGDISLGSTNGTTWITGKTRIDTDTFIAGYDESNRVINKGAIQSLMSGYATTSWVNDNFSTIYHSHSYADYSDISSAIAAHVSEYHT